MTDHLDWVPTSACTLPTAEQPLRVAEFDEFFRDFLTGAELVADTRAELRLSGPAGLVERARDLAERETSCCSFFSFDVRPAPAAAAPGAVLMEISVPAAHSEVLQALVARASSLHEAPRVCSSYHGAAL